MDGICKDTSMTHESLNLWLIEVDKVLKQNKTWEREFRYRFRNLKIGIGDDFHADLSRGDTK